MFFVFHFVLVYLVFITSAIITRKYFLLQSLSSGLFFLGVITLFSLLQLLIRLLSDSKQTRSIPRNEKIWIFPTLSIFSSTVLTISIFYVPSLFDRSFWSEMTGIPTVYFSSIVNMTVFILFFSVGCFTLSFFYWCRSASNDYGKRFLRWKIVKSVVFFVLFFLLSGLLFYVSKYRPSSLLFGYANIQNFKGNVEQADRIFNKIILTPEKGMIQESCLFKLFYNACLRKDSGKVRYYSDLLIGNYPDSIYLDDISYSLLRLSDFKSDECENFLFRFSRSPWYDDVLLRQYVNCRRQNQVQQAEILKNKILGLPWNSSIIIESEGHIVNYPTPRYFEMMANKLYLP